MASRYPPEGVDPDQEIIERDTLLEFPCKFPIKAMGRKEDGFATLIETIVLAHAETYAGEEVTINASGSGNFISVTVTIEALSKDQLDRIYQALTDCDKVLVAL
jgi:putative lipoic acid-binding regulatory protein